jgi:hypothetical protein
VTITNERVTSRGGPRKIQQKILQTRKKVINQDDNQSIQKESARTMKKTKQQNRGSAAKEALVLKYKQEDELNEERRQRLVRWSILLTKGNNHTPESHVGIADSKLTNQDICLANVEASVRTISGFRLMTH